MRSVIIIALLSLLFLVAPNLSLAQPAHDVGNASDAGAPTDGLILASHAATEDDIREMMARFGVRSESDSSEPLIVDGHGTGLVTNSESEWQALVGELQILEVEAVPEELPGSFDLSDDPAFPAVGNQASQGSCAAWAATYYSYGYLEAVDNGWTEPSLGNTGQLMSPAWTYNMVNGGRDKGSWMTTNMMIIRDWGTATMSTMPYDQYDYTSWGSAEAFREAPLHRASEVGSIAYDPATTVDAVKALVASGVPVSYAMDANEYLPSFSDGNFIMSSLEYSSTSLNHAQTIVGFEDSVSDDGEVGAFRVVNSWGTDFGESGYYWFTYSALRELGALDLLTLNFIVDVADYSPSLLGVWHFNTAPSRSTTIAVSVGSTPSSGQTKTPYFEGGFHSRETFPTFMCLDVSELSSGFWPEGLMSLEVGDSFTDGAISSFRIEYYEGGLIPGVATQVSAQSGDVPAATPAAVSANLEYYPSIPVSDALDIDSLDWTGSGQASWVGVDHHSSDGVDSMQTGDISDGARTSLATQVAGPADVSFRWKVSSQSGQDALVLKVDGALSGSISGDVDWTTVDVRLGNGVHSIEWVYEKDASTSSLEDSGWIDSLSVSLSSVEPPEIVLADSYYILLDLAWTLAPSSISYPSESTVSVWYDWGDGSPWSSSVAEDDFGAVHVYTELGEFTLVAYAVDDYGNNVSDDATVHVLAANEYPAFTYVTKNPTTPILLPGEMVTFEVGVSDAEGGALTVVSSYGDGSQSATDTADGVMPGELVVFEFTHCYAEGSDSPFAAVFTVMDSEEHVSVDWNTVCVEVFVNSPPVAALVVEVALAAPGQGVLFDASESHDAETESDMLLFRWDWDTDGQWDTDWSLMSQVTHPFDTVGTYEVTVEVMDGAGLTSSLSSTIEVSGEEIPEFSSVLVPVAALMTLLVLFMARRRP